MIEEARKNDGGTRFGVGTHGFSKPLQRAGKNIGNNKVERT